MAKDPELGCALWEASAAVTGGGDAEVPPIDR
jgi:hypothetical protein